MSVTFESQIISSFRKLNENDTRRTGVEEIETIISNLSDNTLASLLKLSSENTFEHLKTAGKVCLVRLLGHATQMQSRMMNPNWKKLCKMYYKGILNRLKDAESAVREMASDVLGVATRTILLNSNDEVNRISVVLKHLFVLLSDKTCRNAHIGASLGMCSIMSASIVSNSNQRFTTLDSLIPHILGKLAPFMESHYPDKHAILSIFNSCVVNYGGFVGGYLGMIIDSSIVELSNPDWLSRRAAIELLTTLGLQSFSLHIDDANTKSKITSALVEMRSDKVITVRSLVQPALNAWGYRPSRPMSARKSVTSLKPFTNFSDSRPSTSNGFGWSDTIPLESNVVVPRSPELGKEKIIKRIRPSSASVNSDRGAIPSDHLVNDLERGKSAINSEFPSNTDLNTYSALTQEQVDAELFPISNEQTSNSEVGKQIEKLENINSNFPSSVVESSLKYLDPIKNSSISSAESFKGEIVRKNSTDNQIIEEQKNSFVEEKKSNIDNNVEVRKSIAANNVEVSESNIANNVEENKNSKCVEDQKFNSNDDLSKKDLDYIIRKLMNQQEVMLKSISDLENKVLKGFDSFNSRLFLIESRLGKNVPDNTEPSTKVEKNAPLITWENIKEYLRNGDANRAVELIIESKNPDLLTVLIVRTKPEKILTRLSHLNLSSLSLILCDQWLELDIQWETILLWMLAIVDIDEEIYQFEGLPMQFYETLNFSLHSVKESKRESQEDDQLMLTLLRRVEQYIEDHG